MGAHRVRLRRTGRRVLIAAAALLGVLVVVGVVEGLNQPSAVGKPNTAADTAAAPTPPVSPIGVKAPPTSGHSLFCSLTTTSGGRYYLQLWSTAAIASTACDDANAGPENLDELMSIPNMDIICTLPAVHGTSTGVYATTAARDSAAAHAYCRTHHGKATTDGS